MGGHLLETPMPVSLVLSFMEQKYFRAGQSTREEGWSVAASDWEVSRKESWGSQAAVSKYSLNAPVLLMKPLSSAVPGVLSPETLCFTPFRLNLQPSAWWERGPATWRVWERSKDSNCFPITFHPVFLIFACSVPEVSKTANSSFFFFFFSIFSIYHESRYVLSFLWVSTFLGLLNQLLFIHLFSSSQNSFGYCLFCSLCPHKFVSFLKNISL